MNAIEANMKASEAKKLADQERRSKYQNELEEVYKTINSHIKKGEYICTIYKGVSNGVAQELKNDGYHVETSVDPRDGTGFTTINWECAQSAIREPIKRSDSEKLAIEHQCDRFR